MVTKIHLVVLVHGLWGNSSHVQSLADEIASVHPRPSTSAAADEQKKDHAPAGQHDEASLEEDEDDAEVVVLNTVGNAADKTYDGVDFCAGRVVEEIEREVELLEGDGKKKVVYFSMAGYSLGGLVARCVLGILHSQKPSFFDDHTPLNFATFASPWIGMPRYSTFFSAIAAGIGSRMLSRTGAQLYNTDPLLTRMAKKDDVFYQALELFQRVDVYANAVRDRTVPFVTGAFSETDPFSAYETNGIHIETSPHGFPLISSYSLPPPPTPPTPATPPTLSQRLHLSSPPPSPYPPSPYADTSRPFLPPFLRFSFPYNLLFLLSLPIALPVMMTLILWRFVREGRRSKRRIGGVEGEGVRERLRVLERMVESEVEGGLGRIGERVEEELDGLVVGKGGKGSQEKGEGGLRLSESQKGMIRSLDQLKALKKHLVFFPEAFNSHAVIIARDPKGFPEHEKGKQILRHWCESMVLSA